MNSRIRIRFLKTDQQKKQSCVAAGDDSQHNRLYCNHAAASPKRLQATKIQIPGGGSYSLVCGCAGGQAALPGLSPNHHGIADGLRQHQRI